jgi:hypothetical protein
VCQQVQGLRQPLIGCITADGQCRIVQQLLLDPHKGQLPRRAAAG